MRVLRPIFEYIKRTDKLYWLLMFSISAYSLLLLKTVPTPPEKGKTYFFVQLMAVIIGYCGAILFTLIDYHEISNYWYIVAGFCFFLIVYTQIFGIAVVSSGGINAKAWIKLPGTTFQPSELVKIGFILTFSKHVSALKEKGLLKSFPQIALLACHAFIPVILVHLQGDDGSAIIFFCMFLAMAFGAGVQLRYFGAVAVGLAVAFPIAWKYVLQDYQRDRFSIFRHPEDDPLGKGLQQIQGRLSIGSGGFWGRGLFKSPRVNKGLVPVQQSDFIFSVAGEQLGFIGCTLIILLLFLLLMRTLHIARKSGDSMGSVICFGFFGMIAAQALFNLGMCLNLLPVMGVTLPFFSAGGSSASCLYLGFGLVLNVQMHKFAPDKVSLRRFQ
ncbi:MAG TPA: FtsW/RodA/SpoVE family cell cycle protein [Caproiciproducens sp.]|nr:FtsW/RodA/SpoVE family cell cycle protein [Caproiciproducens sp.]